MSEQETAVVIGVGPGLGRALVELFAGEGMRVLAAARNPDKLGTALALEGVEPVACDATDETAVEALFAQAGGAPDLTIFNAGAFVPGGVLETEADEFMRCWQVGCFAGFLAGRVASARTTPPPPPIAETKRQSYERRATRVASSSTRVNVSCESMPSESKVTDDPPPSTARA